MSELIGPKPEMPKYPTPWRTHGGFNGVYDANDRYIAVVRPPENEDIAAVAEAIVKAVNAYYGDTESGSKNARIAELERQNRELDAYIGKLHGEVEEAKRLAEKRLLQRQAAQKRARSAECRVLEAEEEIKRLKDLRELEDSYDRPEDIPAGVKAFQDARGYEAVRLGTGWWWVKCGPTSSPVVARYWELYRAKKNGHGAGGAVAPLTPIPFPDYMYQDGAS